MRSAVLTVMAVTLAVGSFSACSSTPAAVPDGGLGFTVNETIFVNSAGTMVFFLSSRTGLCDLLSQGVRIGDVEALTFGLAHYNNSVYEPVIPATYTFNQTVVDGLYLVNPGVASIDATCGQSADYATVGSTNLFSITAVDGGHATGTYDMFFGLSHVVGGFDAVFCNDTYAGDQPDGGWADGGGIPPCK